MDDEPTVLMDLRGIQTRVTNDAGDLGIEIADEDGVTIKLGSGLGGSREQAILGAERLAETASQYAALLRVRQGDWSPWRPPNPG